MAFKEAELFASGWTAEINSSLMLLFPNRTREAIKGQRKSKKYKDLLEGHRRNSASLSSIQTTSSARGLTPSKPAVSESLASSSATLRRLFRNLVKNQCPSLDLAAVASSSGTLTSILEVSEPNNGVQKTDPIQSESSDEDLNSFAFDQAELDFPIVAQSHSMNEDLELLQEIRADLDATSTSLLEMSISEPPGVPTPAFTLTNEESRLADHLDCLFNSDASSTFSHEFREIWTDFRQRPCKETLFIRTNLFLQVLLPDKSESSRPKQVPSRAPQRGELSKRRQRLRDYARTQEEFRKNPSRCANQLLDPVDTDTTASPFDDDFRTYWETVLSLPTDHRPSFPVLSAENTDHSARD
ncbi:hypothetical protein AVEN_80358-1 [Araneus ventricosus]|uniref:Uncharacterized protein n=1 Tax=Araneus ventricosus TaxID=182803 RepID=A0A4Y2WTQ8_ARAVE|nr:hypothetical protein AVEN_275712-1 [Araneus ventricosus]GBO40184.1 hypothetical protein AVEN_80358-1 [Araneus ventricosus]